LNIYLILNRLDSLAFQQLTHPQQVNLGVAIHATSTVMVLPPEMWWIEHHESIEITTYAANGFPTTLTDSQLQQLDKVYSSCIHPTQYLPQLFTSSNAKLILQIGKYCAETITCNITHYPLIEQYLIAQHCRHLPTMGKHIVSFLFFFV
jgi:hypothetical protein